jgi:hypothetical protein
MPLRKASLGFTPTGAALPTECTQYGTRMIEDQGGYTPIGCPIGPDCYDIIDAVTGQVVVAKAKGKMPWLDLCTQFGYTKDAQPPPTGVDQQQGQCIEPSQTGSGGCRDVIPCPKGPAVSNNPDGAAGPGQGRRYTLVDYKTGELIKEDVGDEIWTQYSVSSLPDAWVCDDPRCKPYCGTTEAAPAPEPEPTPEPTPEPAPEPPPTDEGMVPISIDIQAFTPGGTGPIPAQPIMQPQPLMPPPQAPAPKAVAPAPVPAKPAEKKLDTGSAVGIGAFLVAIGAAAFFGGK